MSGTVFCFVLIGVCTTVRQVFRAIDYIERR